MLKVVNAGPRGLDDPECIRDLAQRTIRAVYSGEAWAHPSIDQRTAAAMLARACLMNLTAQREGKSASAGVSSSLRGISVRTIHLARSAKELAELVSGLSREVDSFRRTRGGRFAKQSGDPE